MPTWPKCAVWGFWCRPVSRSPPKSARSTANKARTAVVNLIKADVLQGVAFVEQEMGKKFGDASDPLLLSVRSGSRASMPGMMDTILNLGLNDEAVVGLARKANNERFRLGLVPPLRADVRRRGHGPQTGIERGARSLRSGHRHAQGEEGRAARHRARHRGPQGTRSAFQGADSCPRRPRVPDRSLGTALGCGDGGLPELEQRPRQGLSRAERHSRLLGYGSKRPGDGLRQSWRP